MNDFDTDRSINGSHLDGAAIERANAVEMAHELSNLLTIILGSLEQLHRQPLDERGRAQLERAQWGVVQTGRLLNELITEDV